MKQKKKYKIQQMSKNKQTQKQNKKSIGQKPNLDINDQRQQGPKLGKPNQQTQITI